MKTLISLLLLVVSLQGKSQLSSRDFGKDFQEIVQPKEIADFESKLNSFPTKPQPLAEFVKPSIDALARANPGKRIKFDLDCGRDVGQRTVVFSYGCMTPLKYGFRAKAVITYATAQSETCYLDATNELLGHKGRKDNIVLLLMTTKLTSVKFTILTRDGKNLLEATCVNRVG